jgi:hypothetical protein
MPIRSIEPEAFQQNPHVWQFNPMGDIDMPFHNLIDSFGAQMIMELDEIVLLPPKKAAIYVTQIFQHYSTRLGRSEETHVVMSHIAEVIKPSINLLDDAALIPKESIFTGFEKNRT